MSLPTPSRPAALVVHWTTRPLGVRLTGVLDNTTEELLEQCLGELSARHPGRVIHVDLTAMASVTLVSAALLVTVANWARENGGELRVHLSPDLERLCGMTAQEKSRAQTRRKSPGR